MEPTGKKAQSRGQGQVVGKTQRPPESEEEEVRRERESLGEGVIHPTVSPPRPQECPIFSLYPEAVETQSRDITRDCQPNGT